jgi:hypothetical protein
MGFADKITVKSNLRLVLRERGKIRARRDGHNIWVNLGREWMSQLIDYTSLPTPPAVTPVTPENDNRIRFMGLGIGGNRQLQLSIANSAPMSVHYPGTNVQSDTDPTVTTLERPVRVSSVGAPIPPPYSATDVWLGQVGAPATHNTPTSTTFVRLFSETDVSYGPFLSVPLSEVGLFLYSPSSTYINLPNNTFVAYDTYDTLMKTSAFSLEIDWTIRF